MDDYIGEFMGIVLSSLDPGDTANFRVAAGWNGGELQLRWTGVPSGKRYDGEHRRMPDRPMLVALAARTTQLRARRDGDVGEWHDRVGLLRGRWPGRFDCEVSIGNGWFDLVTAVNELIDEAGEEVSWSQIKEKFGGLRIYRPSGPIGGELTDCAELLSANICEACGAPGQLIGDTGWWRTRCKVHREA